MHRMHLTNSRHLCDHTKLLLKLQNVGLACVRVIELALQMRLCVFQQALL